MKKVCSCEPGGPLCWLDPMVTYDWSKRPRRSNCDLTVTQPWLEWKVGGRSVNLPILPTHLSTSFHDADCKNYY